MAQSPFILFLNMRVVNHLITKLPPAIPNADQFPFPELNSRLHTDVFLAFNSRLLKREYPYKGTEPLKDQVILDGF